MRHAAAMVRQGTNPAARVYESIGSSFFLALMPGWLNLRLWEGQGRRTRPVTPAELVAGLTQLWVFGRRPDTAMTARQIIGCQLLRALRP